MRDRVIKFKYIYLIGVAVGILVEIRSADESVFGARLHVNLFGISVTEAVSPSIIETLELGMFQLGNGQSKLANLGLGLIINNGWKKHEERKSRIIFHLSFESLNRDDSFYRLSAHISCKNCCATDRATRSTENGHRVSLEKSFKRRFVFWCLPMGR